MKNSRSRAREFALQGLYQWLLSGTEPTTIRAQLAETEAILGRKARNFRDFVRETVAGWR